MLIGPLIHIDRQDGFHYIAYANTIFSNGLAHAGRYLTGGWDAKAIRNKRATHKEVQSKWENGLST